ncbi:ROK family transcriptional regulator [Aminobacter sp. DSM 101952]|uniref:ROK family protein n=1 Tax=Aminobacter sp. DSM 101952 TaxID=2735891 RepID=UPI0006FC3A1E|nr:ROK family protein [Aminobacter sp. DSM 101952]KQU72832.1 ROK family transcriptional regulator [Aminobacter sp. DSM 101952]
MSVGIRHDDLRRRNRAMVISAVRRASQPSRTEIAATTGLSHSTISTISSDLIAEGILAEAKGFEPAAMKRGRPQVALALEPRAASIVAVVLSLNSLSAAVIDYAGNTMAEDTRRLVTQRMPAEALISECIAMIRRLIDGADTSAGPVLRIAIAVQGITDSGSRKLLWSPITRHDDIPFADRLEQEFGVPVTVENDCNMIAEALRWRDPLRYRDDFIAILLSHGIGMGLVIKGELFTGTQSSGAEFGHMIHRPDGALCRCGRRGCIEAYAGNYAIWRNARLGDENAEPLADLSDDDITALADAARDHDGPEREAFRKAGEAIGFGLGSMFALFDPAPLAFVGVGATAFDLMEPHVLSAIAKTAGGLHSKAISFDTEPNEVPLKREGAMMRALLHVDQEIFAAGPASRPPATDVA